MCWSLVLCPFPSLVSWTFIFVFYLRSSPLLCSQVLPDNILRILACQDLSPFPSLASPLLSLSLCSSIDCRKARRSLSHLLVIDRDAACFGTAERKCQEWEITREEGMESDGKMHRRNSFFTDFSMSSPLSTLTFPINFYILHSFVLSLRERLFIHGNIFCIHFRTYF